MTTSRIEAPDDARQHRTAGPYSPALVVTPGAIAVISGQAALDLDGKVVSEDFGAQVHKTIENCRIQFAAVGCSLGDVFKVTVYLTDLDDWPVFNTIYSDYFTAPLPTRTAIGCNLRKGYKVELDMWAAVPNNN